MLTSQILLGSLARLFDHIERMDKEQDYTERNKSVLLAMSFAALLEYPVGIRADDFAGPEWPVVVIQLPTGQVSWHLPEFKDPWDGHDTPTKYERIHAWKEQINHLQSPARVV
jgi:hypothetical protein